MTNRPTNQPTDRLTNQATDRRLKTYTSKHIKLKYQISSDYLLRKLIQPEMRGKYCTFFCTLIDLKRKKKVIQYFCLFFFITKSNCYLKPESHHSTINSIKALDINRCRCIEGNIYAKYGFSFKFTILQTFQLMSNFGKQQVLR